jgi:hypothetical protein
MAERLIRKECSITRLEKKEAVSPQTELEEIFTDNCEQSQPLICPIGTARRSLSKPVPAMIA